VIDAPSDSSDTTRRGSAAWALCAAKNCVCRDGRRVESRGLVPATHLRDALALNDFTELSRPRVDMLANGLLRLLDPLLYTLWGLMLVAVALVRGRRRVALAVAFVLPAAPLMAEVLKPLLGHAHDHVGWGN
jgi:hypothetical protein